MQPVNNSAEETKQTVDRAEDIQTVSQARAFWNFGPDDDLYDVYGSAAVFLR